MKSRLTFMYVAMANCGSSSVATTAHGTLALPAGGVAPTAMTIRSASNSKGLEGHCFEEAQYETLAKLCTSIGRSYPIKYIAGHEHIAPVRKADPGEGFDWPKLQALLGWDSVMFPPAVLTPPPLR